MTIDPQEFDEGTGPPPIEFAMKLSDVVRAVNAAGVALDQVVIVGESCDGCSATVSLDWAKEWEDGKHLTDDEKLLTLEERIALKARLAEQEAERAAEAERRAEEDEKVMGDSLEGW